MQQEGLDIQQFHSSSSVHVFRTVVSFRERTNDATVKLFRLRGGWLCRWRGRPLCFPRARLVDVLVVVDSLSLSVFLSLECTHAYLVKQSYPSREIPKSPSRCVASETLICTILHLDWSWFHRTCTDVFRVGDHASRPAHCSRCLLSSRFPVCWSIVLRNWIYYCVRS